MIAEKPIRILHVVGGMSRGGIETWLMHVLRHCDRARLQQDFLVHTTQPCAYDDEIRSLGGKIIPCLHPRQPGLYARNFGRILREHGPYDVVHSHVYLFSGYVMGLARWAGMPGRIAHTHTAPIQARAGVARRAYRGAMRRLIARHATLGLADSRASAVDFFGPAWESNPRVRLLPCGIDVEPFRHPVDPAPVRTELGLPEDAFVLGHVGRFLAVKNHRFLVEIAAEVAKREPKLRLLLVGDGELRPDIERQVAQAGLADRTVFAGLRSDVPRIMLGAIDLFVLPSLYEGIPLVGTEAQAAGVPAVMSDTVSSEGDVLPELVRRLPLSQPASAWAEAILATRAVGRPIPQPEAFRAVERSGRNIQASLNDLERLYVDARRPRGHGLQGRAESI